MNILLNAEVYGFVHLPYPHILRANSVLVRSTAQLQLIAVLDSDIPITSGLEHAALFSLAEVTF